MNRQISSKLALLVMVLLSAPVFHSTMAAEPLRGPDGTLWFLLEDGCYHAETGGKSWKSRPGTNVVLEERGLSQGIERRAIPCGRNENYIAQFFPGGIDYRKTKPYALVYTIVENHSLFLEDCVKTPSEDVLWKCSGAGNTIFKVYEDKAAMFTDDRGDLYDFNCGPNVSWEIH